MTQRISSLPVTAVRVDAAAVVGPLETWRHSFGHGGVNSLPLPQRVREGVARLQPRLVRIFLQEFFGVYPEHGRFDWTRLDPYMDALAETGAKVVASLCIKPRPLYPRLDERVWRPADVKEWQHVVGELVRRYSVERPIVTHWEIGNEVDIGEWGGCPYLIKDPADYAEYYRMTIQPILEAFPRAKVGGPANASVDNPPLAGFIEHCRRAGTRLDFISHHLYSDDPRQHADCVRKARALLAGFPGRAPETMVTEFSPGFEPTSTEDQAFEPRRAGCVAASVLDMMEAGLDWSFHYHMWDQMCFPDEFRAFSPPDRLPRIMARHWNEIPHRFGLFGVCQEVRPAYFVYWMLHRMGYERLAAASDDPEVRVLAGRSAGRLGVLLANYSPQAEADRVVSLKLANVTTTLKRLTAYRIDAGRRWSPENLEMLPLERRDVFPLDGYECQVYLPAGCVAMVSLEDQ